jgi:hypothetical protein
VNSTESRIQLVIQELRDMDRATRSTIKHQQMCVKASLIEWGHSELSVNTNDEDLEEETGPNK